MVGFPACTWEMSVQIRQRDYPTDGEVVEPLDCNPS